MPLPRPLRLITTFRSMFFPLKRKKENTIIELRQISRVNEQMQTLTKTDLQTLKPKKNFFSIARYSARIKHNLGLFLARFQLSSIAGVLLQLGSMIPSMAELNTVKIFSTTSFTNVQCEKLVSLEHSATT